MYYDASIQTAKCGCKIDIETDVDWPSCRCYADCYSDEYEFSYEIEIIEPCAQHGGS